MKLISAASALLLAGSCEGLHPDYCGPSDEVKIAVMNFTDAPVTVQRGDRIAQGIFLTAPRVTWDEADQLREASRGGFGATG